MSEQHRTTAGVVYKSVSSVNAKWEAEGDPLAEVVKGTMNSPTPLNLPQVEKARCAITGSVCKLGSDVSHLISEHRLSKYGSLVCIDRKYNQFIQMLWVCARLEHIILCFTTAWFAEFRKKNQSREKQANSPT